MCDCGNIEVQVNYSNGEIITHNLSTCAGVTSDYLTMVKMKVLCVRDHGLYSLIQSNESEIASAIEILNNWIVAKTANPQTCDYYEYLPHMQSLMMRIIKELPSCI